MRRAAPSPPFASSPTTRNERAAPAAPPSTSIHFPSSQTRRAGASRRSVTIVLRSTTWTERTVAMLTAIPSAAVKERAGLDAKLLQASVNAIVTHLVSMQGLRRVDAAVLQEVELVGETRVPRIVGDEHD